MQPTRLLVAASLSALLVSLIALLPARVAFGVLGVPATAVTGLTGTVWSGAVQRLSLGNMTLGPVLWHVRPARLLTGQLAAEVKATVPDGFVNATVALSLGGAWSASGVEAAAPLAWLAPAMGSAGLGSAGMGNAGSQLTARFDKLVVRKGRVEAAVGNLMLAGVVLPIPTTGPQLGPGTYELAFSADELGPDDLLTGALRDAGGPLEIAGTVTITPPRSYEVTGTAKPRAEAPPELRSALQMLGPATADGSHALSLAGSF